MAYGLCDWFACVRFGIKKTVCQFKSFYAQAYARYRDDVKVIRKMA